MKTAAALSVFLLLLTTNATAEDSIAGRVVNDAPEVTAKSAYLVDEFNISGSLPNVAFDGRRVFAATQNGVLLARDVQRHATVWQATGQEPLTADAGLVFSQGDSGTMIARDGTNGRLFWQSHKLGNISPRESIAAAGALYIAGNDGIAKLDERNGGVQWIVEDGYSYTQPSIRNGVLCAETSGGSAPIRNNVAIFDVRTGAKLATADDAFSIGVSAAFAGFDADAFYVYAVPGTATIEDGQYVAARISRIALRTGQLTSTVDYQPDPKQHEDLNGQTAYPVLVASGEVMIQLDDTTYIYRLGSIAVAQTPLRFDGLGTPFGLVGNEFFTIGGQGLSHVQLNGQTAHHKHVTGFPVPSADFLRYHRSPPAAGGVVQDDRWLLAADGQNALAIYNMQHLTGGTVRTPCVIISNVQSVGDRVAVSCAPYRRSPGPPGPPTASIVTVRVAASQANNAR